MKTSDGEEMIPGVWYASNVYNYFFRFLRDRTKEDGGGEGIIYSERIDSNKHTVGEYYVTNYEYLCKATRADPHHIQKFVPYSMKIVNNSYKLY